jgi:hypothetical protein
MANGMAAAVASVNVMIMARHGLKAYGILRRENTNKLMAIMKA